MFNQTKLHNFLGEGASEVMEKMFYKKIEPVYNDIDFACDVVVSIEFSGKYNGTFWILLPKKLCYVLSAAFLSMDEADLSDEIVHDTTKEIINMVCGNVLFNFDKSKKFDITIPQIFIGASAGTEVNNLPAKAMTFNFSIEDHPLKMVLELSTGG